MKEKVTANIGHDCPCFVQASGFNGATGDESKPLPEAIHRAPQAACSGCVRTFTKSHNILSWKGTKYRQVQLPTEWSIQGSNPQPWHC